ncbi:SDR family oxidoreductase [Actinophytocola sp.]|uniref:SDR family oxidoreductase n=1 Tax=Actinophytocola sp. TaxID=1872138 RepID=UPI003D6AC536
MSEDTLAVVGIAGSLATSVADALAAVGKQVLRASPGEEIQAGVTSVHVADPVGYPLPEIHRHLVGRPDIPAVIVADTRTEAPGDWPPHGGPAVLRAAVERLSEAIRLNAVAVIGPQDRAVSDAVGAAVAFLTSASATPVRGQCLVVDASLAAPTPVDRVLDRVPAGEHRNIAERSTVDERADPDAVVVVGMGLALPHASSPEDLWQLLHSERTVFGEPQGRIDIDNVWSPDPTDPDRTYSRVSGFMPADDAPPSDDFAVMWLRHSITQAMAPVRTGESDRHLFAVGLTADGSQHLEQSLVVRQVRRLLGETDPGATRDLLRELYPLATDDPERMLPYRIARRAAADLPADTEIVVLDTACSSSLYSIDIGARALRAGEADVAVCGGAFVVGIQNLVLFSKLRGLSRSGVVRPLDSGADGVLFTDGAAVLVLKTAARASADGDTVLGYVAGFGGSSDGRGKAIYAPNPVGQRLALHRAWEAAGIGPADIDWLIAHATGTPAGDRTELSVLLERAESGRAWTVSSNKSVVGHPGWAAGAVSAIHALLALRHGVIPAQRHFTQLPGGLDDSALSVPTRDVAWPAGERARIVGVSAMGFGGTNGHLLLTDISPVPPARTEPAVPPGTDPVVVAGWAAHLPDDPDHEQVRRWLRGGPAEWSARFGADYSVPAPMDLRLAPSAIAAMDRSQVIAVRCADDLAGDWFGDSDVAVRSGVFVGHSGPTTAAVLHDTRAYLDDLAARAEGRIERFAERVATPVRHATPAATEDSYPGLMPNIIPARVAQRLNLNGPNMAFDAGLDSFNSALVTAARSLRDDEIDVAFVIGVAAAAAQVAPRDGREPAEGALGVVLTRRSTARELPLTELAVVEVDRSRARPVKRRAGGDRVHHGAEGAVELLRTLHGEPGRTVLHTQEDNHTASVVVTVPDPAGDATGGDLRDQLERHVLELVPTPALPARAALPAIPADCVVVTDDPTAFGTQTGLVLGPDTDPSDIEHILADVDLRHVRIALDAGRAFDTLLALNDVAFATVRALAASLSAGGSVGVLVTDGFAGAVPRPVTGLYSGLVRSLERELPDCLAFAVVTDSAEMSAELAELGAESGRHRHLPVAYLRGGARYELIPRPLAPPDPSAPVGVDPEPVLLATGGARGITARLVRELLAGAAPRGVWLVGTAPEPDLDTPAELPDKPEALRELLARHPGESLAALNQRYEDAVRAAERTTTMLELRRRFGPDRVHYRRCDVRDAAAVHAVVDEILRVDDRIDVVVHGAGLVRSAALTRKSLADYRLVRDVKVLGDRNLRAALATRPPALWCGLSSVGAFIGMRGEVDYQAANEYLMLTAAAARADGRDELALVSGLWVESGMASGYATGSPFTSGLADFTRLTDEQGAQFFRAELAGRTALDGPALACAWLGETEWRTLHRNAPGLRDRAGESTPHRPPVFLTVPPRHDGDERAWLCRLDLDEHPWLLDHLVDDRPTVPAAVMLQIAAEAAVALAPGLLPVRFTDMVLSSFIRALRSHWPRSVAVVATRVGDAVHVRLSSPPAGPVPSREHARMTVRLAPAPDAVAPVGDPRPTGVAVRDVYQLDGSLRLRGVFAGLHDVRLHDEGGSALFTLPADGGRFDEFMVPSVTIDALLRTSVLDGGNDGKITLKVPTELRAVEIHLAGNDREWGSRSTAPIVLRHHPGAEGETGSCVATASDGTMLIRIDGISSVARETYDVASAAWLTTMAASS